MRPSREPTFHFIGGKGGVGKTTCAASFGIAAAESGARVLVASTDPAPSLADALNVPLSSTARRIPTPRGGLFAVEIDAARSLPRWIDARRAALEQIAVQGTWLDADDAARLLRLSLPGIDEIAALFEIARLAAGTRFDHVVIDTAPTGHTLRMLALPGALAGVARVFERMREKERVMQEALRGAWTADTGDAVIAELASTAAELTALLRDRQRTQFTWVTLPEPLAVAETEDALRALAASGIRVETVVANRLTPAPRSRCVRCEARLALESSALRRLPRHVEVRHVRARDVEPRGVAALGPIARDLRGPAPAGRSVRRASAWAGSCSGPPVDPCALVPASTRLILLGGKGGVGKSTCAAALALALAHRAPAKSVLLISVDPAHSLGDVLAQDLTDAERAVARAPANLRVRELDAARVLGELQAKYVETVDRLFDRMGGGTFDASYDRSIMRGLIDLAPPGLDELAAILRITDAILADPPPADVVVIDTAPTGHALRLLEMPALVQDWTRALMSILLKYQGVVPMGEAGAALLDLSQAIGRLKTLLADPERTSFLTVTRPAALPRLETMRLLRQLRRLGLHVPCIIVNAVGRGTCARCVREAAAQRAEIERLTGRASRRGPRTILAPEQAPPPRGPAALERWSRTWVTHAAPARRRSALRYHRSS